MSYRKKILVAIIITIIFASVGYVFTSLIQFEFSTCGSGYAKLYSDDILSDKISYTPSCIGFEGFLYNIDKNIGLPLIIFSLITLLILIILLFSREEIFHTWKKFAIIYILLSLIIITLAPTSAPNIISFDKESATLWLAVIFLIVSLAIIIAKTVKLRREER